MPRDAAVMDGALSVLAGKDRPGAGGAPEVIWSSAKQIANDQAWFAREFKLTGKPVAGELAITCDNQFTAFVNGKGKAKNE